MTDETTTAAAHLTQVMAQNGFEPSRVYNAFFIEFAKTYADSQGRMARAVVQFERPGGVGGPERGEVRLSGFSALVQAQIPATEEGVLERAPPVMQQDLLVLVDAFQNAGPPRRAVALEKCSACRAPVSEFFVVKGDVLCRECKEK